ncbi:MAG: TetR/AcrR family transcriptional regulator [Arenicella sp.]|nr:TetR/AcrR family transcriptional regulator [Arenicella sp.]
MKILPTQERALIKRQALIDAATAEFSSIGFEVATAKSIASVAEVATGTFYQYFDNKNEILRVIASTRFDGLHQQIGLLELKAVNEAQLTIIGARLDIEGQFSDTLMFVYQFHAGDPELHQVLEQRRALDPKLQTIMDQGEAVLKKRVLTFVNTFNISNAELIAENLFAMAEGLVHRLVFHSSLYNSTERDRKEALEVGAKMLASYFIQNQAKTNLDN